MSIELIYALFWFASGAFLHKVIFTYHGAKEQRDMLVSIMSSFILLGQHLQDQIALAIEHKRNVLRDAGMDEKMIEEKCEEDEKIVQSWGVIFATILVKAAPKSYVKYFEKTGFKDFKGNIND